MNQSPGKTGNKSSRDHVAHSIEVEHSLVLDLEADLPKKKREGLSNINVKAPSALSKPPSRRRGEGEAEMERKQALDLNRLKRRSSGNHPLFADLESAPMVKYPREHFDVLMAGPPALPPLGRSSSGYQSRGASFSGPSKTPSMLSNRHVSISTGFIDDGV